MGNYHNTDEYLGDGLFRCYVGISKIQQFMDALEVSNVNELSKSGWEMKGEGCTFIRFDLEYAYYTDMNALKT